MTYVSPALFLARGIAFPLPWWVLGIFLCVVSNGLTALGLVTQKYSHSENEKISHDEKLIFYRQPYWLAGMSVFLVGQAANIGAMALTPQTMLTCLGGLSLVFNTTYAHFILGERLRCSELLAITAMVTGATLVVSSTPVHIESKVFAGQIVASVLRTQFLMTAAVILVAIAILGIISMWKKKVKPFFWGMTCAACGSYSVTLFKCGAELVTSTRRWWLRHEIYGIAAVALCVCLVQVHTLNLGLRHGDVVKIIPTFFALGVLFSLVQAQLAFGELNGLSGVREIAMFVSGVTLVVVSTIAMVLVNTEDDDALVDEDVESRDQRVPLLHRKTSSEPSLRRNHWSVSSLGMLSTGSFDEDKFWLPSMTGPMGVIPS